MRRTALAICLLMLAGCQSGSLQDLRSTPPRGSEFQQALAMEYLYLSSQEEANYDWRDAWYFADKGLTAAYGNDVGPENVSDWNIPPEHREELEAARDRLLSALPPRVVSAEPKLAARAYRMFDCWVERQEDNWEKDKIAECKAGFEETVAHLEAGAVPVAASGVDTTSYIVFFDWNRASLNKAGQKQVREVADSLAGETGYDVILNGHTDTTGLERFNLSLSKRRAETVARELAHAGIDPDVIKIFAFGESDPRVPTADEVNEPQNRRVEIFIQ